MPDDAVEDILQVARWTGSGMNQQPWDLVLVRNRDTLKQIADAEGANSHLGRASFAIFIVMPEKGGEIETFDEARLTERLLLAAAAHGLAAGIWWLRPAGVEPARRILGIPDGKKLRTAISFGYPVPHDPSQPKRKDARRPLSELVHRERY